MILRLIGPRKGLQIPFASPTFAQIPDFKVFLIFISQYPNLLTKCLSHCVKSYFGNEKKANPWLFTDFTIYPKFPDHRIADAQRLTGTAERLKRPEISTKYVKRVNGTRISIRNVLAGKTGPSFQNFRSSHEFLVHNQSTQKDWVTKEKNMAADSLRSPFSFVSRRSPAVSLHGAVCSSQPLATTVGTQILKAGGNAADAAVAVAAALNVTEPCSTGIGGDAFCLFYDAERKIVKGINGRYMVYYQ